MKPGDKVYSIKVKIGQIATIIKVDIQIKKELIVEDSSTSTKTDTRTKYIARYPDRSLLVFYGFDVNKNVFKKKEQNGQMSIFDDKTRKTHKKHTWLKEELWGSTSS